MSCLLKLKKYGEVVRLCTDLLPLEPRNHQILSMKAEAEYHSGNYEIALCFYYRGIRCAPTQKRDTFLALIRNRIEFFVHLTDWECFRRTEKVIGDFLHKKSSKRETPQRVKTSI